jgi:tetratricopeptide (TPR) repeat protein
VKPPNTPPAVEKSAGPSAKDKGMADQYARAKSALDGGSFANAVGLFEALQREEPGYRDVADQLTRAKQGVASAVKEAMDTAAKAEGAGEFAEALRLLQRVRQIDPSMAIVAEQSITRIQGRMRTEGTAAFTNARQFDAVERVDDAIKWYERAFRLLPDDDPNKKAAKDRLDLLRARK